MTNKDNILPEEEYCHYSGLPSAKFYENTEKLKKETSDQQKTGLIKRDPEEIKKSRCKAYKYLIP
jgi:hypothetical protein